MRPSTLPRTTSRRRPPGHSSRKVRGTILLVIMCGGALLPLAWLAIVSLMPQAAVATVTPRLFAPTLDNYAAILSDGPMLLRAFVNSVTISVIATAIAVVAGVLGAYSIARLKPVGSRAAGALILSARLLPPLALVVPSYIAASSLSLLDTPPVLILPYAALATPMAMWIVQGAFLDMPKELEEAAMIDGCNRFQAFYSIVMPLAAPAIAAAAIMSFILAWNDLLLALPLTLQNAVTMPVFASQATTDIGIEWGRLGATTVVMIIPVAVFTYFAQRWIVSGLTAGAAKG